MNRPCHAKKVHKLPIRKGDGVTRDGVFTHYMRERVCLTQNAEQLEVPVLTRDAFKMSK